MTEGLGYPVYGTGDAVDDLSDIIKDLKQINWRLQNTSYLDTIWYVELLLSYLRDVND